MSQGDSTNYFVYTYFVEQLYIFYVFYIIFDNACHTGNKLRFKIHIKVNQNIPHTHLHKLQNVN